MPIQLRAACEPVSTEALFSEGSRGEYEASARKRRSAETHNRNPTSSLSRRLLVGTKMRAKNVMWASSVASLAPNDTRTRDARSTPEPVDYAKNNAARQSRISAAGIELVSGRMMSKGCSLPMSAWSVRNVRYPALDIHIRTAVPKIIRYTAKGANPRRRTHAINHATEA